MKEIKLTQEKVAIVDDEMFDFLNEFNWHSHFDGSNFYAARKYQAGPKKGRKMFMHHAIAGFPLNNKVIDHVNRNSLDNRRENLRIVSVRENSLNSKFPRDGKGYFWNKRKKRWISTIRFRGKAIYIGSFRNEGEARLAFLNKQKVLEELHGN